MKIKLLTGLFLALAGFCVSTLFSVLGYYSDPAHLHTAQVIDTPLRIVMALVGLWLGIRACRDSEASATGFSYGQGVAAGTVISLWQTLFGVILTIVFFTVIDPGAREVIIQSQVAAAAAKGADPEKVEKGVRMFTSLPLMADFTAIMTIFFGVLFSLLVAAFLRRPAPAPGSAAAAQPV